MIWTAAHLCQSVYESVPKGTLKTTILSNFLESSTISKRDVIFNIDLTFKIENYREWILPKNAKVQFFGHLVRSSSKNVSSILIRF